MNTIYDMKPSDILRKKRFGRLIPCNVNSLGIGTSNNMQWSYVSQADFLREFHIESHIINSLKYHPNNLFIENSGSGGRKISAKVKTRTAVAWQDFIHTRRLATLTGGGVVIKPVSRSRSDADILSYLKEGWEYNMMDTYVHDMISADGKVGDSAMCFSLHNSRVNVRVFSFESGDELFPHYDPATGGLSVFGRTYSFDDKEYIDVWDTKHYMRYVKEGAEWITDIEPVPHYFPDIPIVYVRSGAPFWNNSQSSIERYEMNLSQLAENNQAYALRIMYSLGNKFKVSSSLDGTPVRIDSSDVNAKIGYLEPADASKSFELELDKIEKAILSGSHVNKTPEIKSGSDVSSLAIKMMFADQYLKGLNDINDYRRSLNMCLYLFRFAYGVESSKDFMEVRATANLFPYIFMSETEETNTIVQLTGVGALSKQSASEEAYILGYGTTDEWDRIKREEHELISAEPSTEGNVNYVNNMRNAQS